MLSRLSRTSARFGVVALAMTLCGALAACSGDDSSTPDETSSSAPGGLTAPGTDLAVDDAATVDFKAGPKRQSKIKVAVTGVQEGSVKDLRDFDLKEAERRSGVYYVRATVRNVGHGDLGGAFLTLYGKVSSTLVVRPVMFGSTFGKCNYQPLPKPFKAGKRADVCIVMLAPDHGAVSAVEWRFPDAEPITWELS